MKTVSSSQNGVICIEAAKITSRKKVPYGPDDFDFLAVYVIDRNRIAYVPMSVIHGRTMSLRFEPAKNCQVKGTQNFDDYKDL